VHIESPMRASACICVHAAAFSRFGVTSLQCLFACDLWNDRHIQIAPRCLVPYSNACFQRHRFSRVDNKAKLILFPPQVLFASR
jgi:hypothetical protein